MSALDRDMMLFLRGLLRRRWLWIGVGLLALYTAVGFWLVPRWITSAVRDGVAERYHRVVRLGVVKFNPFTLEVEARDFALPDADGGPLLAFDRLYVNLAASSLLRFGPDFQAIELDRPQMRVVRRPDGGINLEDLSGPPDPKPDPNTRPPRLWIQRLAIQDGAATVIDQDRPTPLTLALRPITFELREFSARGNGNAYALAVESTLGERLAWRGTFGLAPVASRGSFKLSHVRAQTLAAIAESIPFAVTSGELELSGSYVVDMRGKVPALQALISELTLSQLAIRAHGDASDTLQLPRLEVRGTRVDALAQTVAVDHIGLEQPKLDVARNRDGSLNLQQLLPGGPAAPASGKPWSIALPDIQLARAEVDFTDRSPDRPAHVRIAPLDVSVAGFASPISDPVQLHVAAGIGDSGHISADGQLALTALTGSFDVAAAGIPLVPLQPYLDDLTGLILKSGSARLQGKLTLGADAALALDGSAGVDDLLTVDEGLEEDFVKWRSLDLLGLRAVSAPLAISVDQLIAREPYARVIIAPDGMTNIQEVLTRGRDAPPPPATVKAQPAAKVLAAAARKPASAEPASQAAALPLAIDLVRVEDGSLNFADLSIRPNFATGVQHIAGTIKGLSARPDARADVDLAGQVTRYTPVKISGKVNYFAAVKHTRLRLTFKNLELTGLSPYSGKFAGYKIERGKLNVDLNYKLEDRRLDAQHKLIVNQLQLGDAVESPDATSLPVKLAVALLKDRNGVIDLDLPVSGNLDDPQFKLGPIIWKALLNLLVKVVTSPFALLGSLFGGGEEISYIDFSPGSGALDPSARAKLQTLAKALDSRPTLNLDVPLVIEPQADRAALVDRRWREDIAARAAKQLGPHGRDPGAVAKLLATPAQYRTLLEAAYRQQFGRRPEIPRPVLPSKPPPPPPVQTQAQRLSHLVGPGHGALQHRAPASPPPAASRPRPSPAPVPASGGRGALVKRTPLNQPAPPVPDAYAIPWLERQLKQRIRVEPIELAMLAQARAESVQSVILDGTGIDPGRVFVITAPPLTAARGPLRMQLSLH